MIPRVRRPPRTSSLQVLAVQFGVGLYARGFMRLVDGMVSAWVRVWDRVLGLSSVSAWGLVARRACTRVDEGTISWSVLHRYDLSWPSSSMLCHRSLCFACGCALRCRVRYVTVLLLCPHLSMLSTLHLLPLPVCALRVVDSGQRGRLYIIIPLPAFYRAASLVSVRYACCLCSSLNDDQHGCLYITVTAIRLLPCCLVLHTCCVRCV